MTAGPIPQLISLLSLPDELIHTIASFVDSPKDLLHLALTCHVACTIVIPHHIEYRVLRLKSHEHCIEPMTAFLPALVSRPTMASCFRDFRLEPGPTNIFPSSFVVYNTSKLRRKRFQNTGDTFLVFISQLRGLRNFSDLHYPKRLAVLLTVLAQSCSELKHITVGCPANPLAPTHTPSSLSRNKLYKPNVTFSSLVSLKIVSASSLSDIHGMLDLLSFASFPKLAKLDLRIAPELLPNNAYCLLEHSFWPEMQDLIIHLNCHSSIQNFFYQDTTTPERQTEIFQSFLIRHPKLQTLILKQGGPWMLPKVKIPPELCANLETFALGHFQFIPPPPIGTFLSERTATQLRKTAGFFSQDCYRLLPHMVHLEHIIACVHEETFIQFLESLPSTILSLEIVILSKSKETSPARELARVSHILRFKNLTHIGGLFPSLGSGMYPSLLREVSSLPQLKEVKLGHIYLPVVSPHEALMDVGPGRTPKGRTSEQAISWFA